MTKYEQKLRERAEEMATAYPYSWGYNAHPNHFMIAARVSINAEAEAYTIAFMSGRDKMDEPYNSNSLQQQLKSLGLMP